MAEINKLGDSLSELQKKLEELVLNNIASVLPSPLPILVLENIVKIIVKDIKKNWYSSEKSWKIFAKVHSTHVSNKKSIFF